MIGPAYRCATRDVGTMYALVREECVMAELAVRAKVIRIGNSRGVRIPKALLAGASIGDDVDLVADGDKIVIRASPKARAGWSEAFAGMHSAGDDRMLGSTDAVGNRFDDEEWTW